MWFILTSLLFGFLVGLLARGLVRDAGPSGCIGTTALGIVGSFGGGFLGYALFDRDLNEGALQPSGLLGSLLGAVLVLVVVRAWSRR